MIMIKLETQVTKKNGMMMIILWRPLFISERMHTTAFAVGVDLTTQDGAWTQLVADTFVIAVASVCGQESREKKLLLL